MSTEGSSALVSGVYGQQLGDKLTASASIGATTLTVKDTVDFDEDGGWLRLNGELLEYLGYDEDTSTITLASGIGVAAAVDDLVDEWDVANNQPTVVYKAVLDQIDGFDGKSIEAVVTPDVASVLSTSMRTGKGESVTLSDDNGELTIEAVNGRSFALAATQYLQGGMTTRQADDEAGVDVVGADSGAPGVYLYDVGGALGAWLDSQGVHLQDGAVTSTMLEDGAVTAAKTAFIVNDIGGVKFTVSATAPASPSVGDIWSDSGNGFVLKRWNGSTWASIQDAAIATASSNASTALTQVNGKNKTFIQSTTPTATTTGDTWIDTGNGNVIKVWDGSTWVNRQDAAIASAASAASTAQSTANGKNKVTYSTSSPGTTANAAGDLWFRTSGSTVIEQWQGNGGTSWTQVTVTDAVIANLDAAKITSGILNAARIAAGSIAASKLAVTVGGGNLLTNSNFIDTTNLPLAFGSATRASETTTTYRSGKSLKITSTSASNPFGMGVNNVVTESISTRLQPNTSYVASAWVFNPASGGVTNILVDVAGTGVASETTNPVTTTGAWVRTSTSFTTGASGNWSMTVKSNANPANGAVFYIGALQVEIGDLPTAYVPQADEILPGTIVAAMIAANTITASQIAADTITAGQIAAGAITVNELAANAVTAAKIAAGTITANELAANAVTAGKIAAGAIDSLTITSPTIRTASSGTRMEMQNDPSGGIITFLHGISGEFPGILNPQLGTNGQPQLALRASTNGTDNVPVGMTLSSGSTATGHQPFISLSPSVIGTVVIGSGFSCDTDGNIITGSVHTTGDMNCNGALDVSDDATCHGILSGNRVMVTTVPTTGGAANVRMAAGTGELFTATSSLRYKQDVEDAPDRSDAILTLTGRTWRDRVEVEADPDTELRYVGFIAEELHDAGLTEYVDYDDQGRPNAIQYDRLTVPLLDLAKRQQAQLVDQAARLDRLEALVADLVNKETA